MDRKRAAHAGGLSILSARKIWRAMGFPNMSADEVYFTQRDSQALRRISGIVESDQLSEEAALSLIRAMAQMTDRMVVWQVEAIVEDLVMNRGYSDAEARQELLELLPRIQQDLEDLLLYTWRRQLNGAVQRLAMRQERPMDAPQPDEVGDESASLPLARGIGFADMVSFTTLSRKMNERTLAALVQRFEQRCAEIISAGGGRLIKTIGDEVMYMSESPEEGALIALALRRAILEDPELPKTRVGFVWGRVLPRLGDLYGPTVNLASRLVALAEPGGVLVDASTASVLEDDDRFILAAQPPQSVRGFGDVRPVRLTAGTGLQLEVDYE
jgi:adenylate cyclase